MAKAKKLTSGAGSKPSGSRSTAATASAESDENPQTSSIPKAGSAAKAESPDAQASSGPADTGAAAKPEAEVKSGKPDAKPGAPDPKPTGTPSTEAKPDATAKAETGAAPATNVPKPGTSQPDAAAKQSSLAEKPDTAKPATAAPRPDAGKTVDPFPASPPPQGSGGGFAAGLLGGALAVAAGIGVLWLSNPDLLRGEAIPDIAPLSARIDAQAAEAAAVADELAQLRAELAETGGEAGASPEALAELQAALSSQVETITADLDSVSSALDVLEGRIEQVEARPPVMAGDAGEATAQIVADMRAALASQRAEIETLADEARARIESAEAEAAELQVQATEAARSAVARAALSRLQAALDAGAPFAGALSDLSGSVDVDIPAALSDTAETGVPTLMALRQDFPEAARTALAATIRSSVDPDDGPMERIGAFLKAQTGARSITPREGSDPDAVLSRAEAALAEGELRAALSLLDTLPEPGLEAVAGWRAGAEARADALDAAAELSATLTQN